jgi:uracil-DNA glycosylase
VDQLAEIVGTCRRTELAGVALDLIALPHPSGASTWHRMEPGKTLLARALSEISRHPAWRAVLDARDPSTTAHAAEG